MNASVTIDMKEFEAAMAKLSRIAQTETALDALEAGGAVIETYAKNNVANKLNKHPTGYLANSIRVKREGKIILVGSWGVAYNKIHEFGGVIRARNAKALRFQVNGEWVMRKSVTMPARPYLRPAVDDHMPEIKEAIADAFRGLLAEQGST